MKSSILAHKKDIWILFTPEPKKSKFSPLIDFIDWHNNQLLAKACKTKRLNLDLGEKTLFQTSHLIPAEKLISVGTEGLTGGKKVVDLCAEVSKMISDLSGVKKSKSSNAANTWAIVSTEISDTAREALVEKLKGVVDDVTVG